MKVSIVIDIPSIKNNGEDADNILDILTDCINELPLYQNIPRLYSWCIEGVSYDKYPETKEV